jgi:hypothetical protein
MPIYQGGGSSVSVKSLTEQTWPGIRNEGEATDSRRRNGLIEASVAAAYQEDLLLF